MVVAIDGYSSTGKSTVAKRIAKKLGLIYIDTGAMYRVVTLVALRIGALVDGKIDEEKLRFSLKDIKISFRYNHLSAENETFLNDECVEREIRSMKVSEHVSNVAALDFVRHFLVAQQREMGAQEAVIMDGRDIGSVVFPHADVKFFMTASPEVRATRRYEELKAKGDEVTYEEVFANVIKRDDMDSHRKISPLVQMPDAIVIDNSHLTLEEEVEWMVREIENKQRKIAQ